MWTFGCSFCGHWQKQLDVWEGSDDTDGLLKRLCSQTDKDPENQTHHTFFRDLWLPRVSAIFESRADLEALLNSLKNSTFIVFMYF